MVSDAVGADRLGWWLPSQAPPVAMETNRDNTIERFRVPFSEFKYIHDPPTNTSFLDPLQTGNTSKFIASSALSSIIINYLFISYRRP